MDEYVKINTIWKRDEAGTIVPGDFATPELEYLSGSVWEWTEKVDGTNVRVGWDGEKVRFGGRTAEAQISVKLLDALSAIFLNDKIRGKFGSDAGTDVVLYGEGYGAGIQRGGLYRPDQSFVLFDVKVDRWWLRRSDVEDVALALGIEVVPIVERASLVAAANMMVHGLPSNWSDGNFPMEGLVGRPSVDLFDRAGDRIMAKIKTKDYSRFAQVQKATIAAEAKAREAAAAEEVAPAAAAATT